MSLRAGRAQVEWETPENGLTWQHVIVEVLQDIRHELRRINETLQCHNTREIPFTLKRIDRRLAAHAPLKRGKR